MKSVKQVFIADQGNNAIGTALGSVADGDFVLIEGGANTTIDNVANVTTPFFHFALGTATTPIVSDAFTVGGGLPTSSVATYQAAVDKIVNINVGKVSCETEYMLKIRFEGEAVAKAYGYNDLIKTFSYTTDCCDPCDTACPSGSCLDLIKGLVLNVNADEEGLVQSAGVSNAYAAAAGIATAPALFTEADFEAYAEYVAANGITAEDVCNDLTLAIQGQTSDPKALVCGQDPMSLTQTVVDFHVGLLGGFDCNGSSVTVKQEVVFAVGEPYQVANLARWAEGYKRKFGVYRVPFPYGTFESNGEIDPAGQYDIVTISINEVNPSAATLNPSLNIQEIVVAVPSGSASTVTALV